jgi:hypothetical protein
MRVDLLSPGPYDALVLRGAPSDAADAPEQMAVVLKGAYDLVEEAPAEYRMEPAADPSAAALIVADDGRCLYPNPDHDSDHPDPAIPRFVEIPTSAFGSVPRPDGTERFFFRLGTDQLWVDEVGEDLVYDLKREADLAMGKSVADVVVHGWGASTDAAVVVDHHTWLTRDLPEDLALHADDYPPDVTRHVFGWQARGEGARAQAAEDGDAVAHANVYRRTTGFGSPHLGTALPSAGLVEVHTDSHDPTASDGEPALSVRLPDLDVGLRLRVYCGHGPDEAPRWRIVPRDDLVPDTLVLRPGQHRAEICWRQRWSLADQDPDSYRSVQIRAGGF